MRNLYQQIDWQQAWYHNLQIPPLANDTPTVKDWLNYFNPSLTNYYQKPLQFIAQNQLPDNVAYETHIAETGNIATRENFHDLLNGIIWLNFPKTKAIFNHLHHQDIVKNGVQSSRSTLRNILTLFDENGGMVVSSRLEILQQLQTFNWQSALFDNRQAWLNPQKSVDFFPIGHALLEKLIQPRKNITAHLLLILVENDWFLQKTSEQRQRLDNFLSNYFLTLGQLDDNQLNAKMFQPLPILGIADFCPENKQLAFYQDVNVFRPQQQRPMVTILSLS